MTNDNYTTICITNPWEYMTQKEVYQAWYKHPFLKNGVWKNLKLVENPYEADWVVGWETLDLKLDRARLDMSKIILLGREPPWILSLGNGPLYDNWDSFPDVKFKFKPALGNTHLCASWTSTISYDEMAQMEWKPRNKKLCVVMSSKNFCWGHNARLDFVRRYCQKYPDTLDIYGKGMQEWCAYYGLDSHYRGSTVFGQDDSKHTWISRYSYSLSLENGLLDGFFTEKFNDVAMAFAKPIFWGAPNMTDYFPADSFVYLDITSDTAPDDLHALIQQPISEKDVKAMSRARQLIMNTWNEWPTIKRIIDTGSALPEKEGDLDVST
jgi:hypothetical protein